MNLLRYIITWFFRKLGVPQLAIDMFHSAGKLSRIELNAVPKELIPLNSIQYARGILNFAFIQANPDWLYPYWINRQFDPAVSSFIPRSHLGLVMNITQRSWTAVGNPECDIEPIVDPRGLVTPFRNSWSLDIWLAEEDNVFFPSQSSNCRQYLIENCPIVATEFSFMHISLKLTAFTLGSVMKYKAEITNSADSELNIRICLSIRPFNPEGCTVIKKIEYNRTADSFKINHTDTITLSSPPDAVRCHSLSDGDVSHLFLKAELKLKDITSSSCDFGFANAAALYNVRLDANASYKIECTCPLINSSSSSDKSPSHPKDVILKDAALENAISFWKELLSHAAQVTTPDNILNSLVTAGISTLLLLCDKNIITPGPFTYHHFWIRDAAYMVLALDRFGYFDIADNIISAFFNLKERSGYFRSQGGEWDSNGQVLWIVYQHSLLSGSTNIAEKYFSDLFEGVKWISQSLLKDKDSLDQPFYGLLPKGLSAEHLGLADHYYWDNFWSVAGIKAFISLCRILGKKQEEDHAVALLNEYEADIKRSLDYSFQSLGSDLIPAAPGRRPDSGMIGSVCASYPLMVFDPESIIILNSIDTIYSRFFHNNLFYQEFIHSGYNIYLTLHVAHSYLYAGLRDKFNTIFRSVIESATPDLNYPEAIHPFSGGGSMGDGHHGWAAADTALAAIDMFVYSCEKDGMQLLYLLRGIPHEWFKARHEFSINKACTSLGKVSVKCSFNDTFIIINVTFDFHKKDSFNWILELPFNVSELSLNQKPHKFNLLAGQTTKISGNENSVSENKLIFIIKP